MFIKGDTILSSLSYRLSVHCAAEWHFVNQVKLEMWANAQRDGRPAEYRQGGHLFNASVQRRKVWLTPNTGVPCSNAAKTRKPLKFAGVRQTNETISATSGPKFAILWGHVQEVLVFNKFFLQIVDKP